MKMLKQFQTKNDKKRDKSKSEFHSEWRFNT